MPRFRDRRLAPRSFVFAALLVCACAQPTVSSQGGSSASTPANPTVAADEPCPSPPDGALAHVAKPECGLYLTAGGGELRVWALGEVSDTPRWVGPMPPRCEARSCQFELVASPGGPAVFVLEAGSGPEAPEQLWFTGPLLPAQDGEHAAIPLWGGERIQVDSSDFGPTYELLPHLCDGELRLRLNTREPAASVDDAPDAMREMAADAPSFEDGAGCREIRASLG